MGVFIDQRESSSKLKLLYNTQKEVHQTLAMAVHHVEDRPHILVEEVTLQIPINTIHQLWTHFLLFWITLWLLLTIKTLLRDKKILSSYTMKFLMKKKITKENKVSYKRESKEGKVAKHKMIAKMKMMMSHFMRMKIITIHQWVVMKTLMIYSLIEIKPITNITIFWMKAQLISIKKFAR